MIEGLPIEDAVRELKTCSAEMHATRVGRRLRRHSLDELPQLWNVIRGDMGLVGPRPMPEYEALALHGWQASERHSVRPGITGLWQVSGRNAISWEERVHLDVVYARHWSVISDLRHSCPHGCSHRTRQRYGVSNARRYRGRPLSVGRAPALRVLHVAQPSDGGSLVCAAHLVVDQIARGWTVGVATQSNLLSRTAEDHGANYFAWTALRRPGFSVPEESHRLSRIVACFAPDVLHLHAAKAGLCGRLAVRGRRATLYQPHGWSFYAADGH